MKVTFQTCCGVDVHKSFLVATIIKTSSGIEPPIRKDVFLLSTILFLNSRNGYLKINASMSAWNPLVSTGSLSSIFLKMKSMLLLLIPSRLKLLKVIRMTQRIRNGLEICSV